MNSRLRNKIHLRGFRNFYRCLSGFAQVVRVSYQFFIKERAERVRKALNQSYLHLVWATWDRLPLLTPDRKRQAYALIPAECARMNVLVVAIGGTDNHVHLLIHHTATLTISGIAKQIKGASSYALNRTGTGGWFK